MHPHTFLCVDAHTCGNPVRVVAGGGPGPAQRAHGREKADLRRRARLGAPGPDVRAARPRRDVGLDPLSAVAGGLRTRRAVHRGLGLPADVRPRHDRHRHGGAGTGLRGAPRRGAPVARSPGGKVEVEYRRNGRFIDEVRLYNIPSYLHAADVRVEVPGLGPLTVDVSYGGNFYAIVEPQPGWAGLDGMTSAEILTLSPLVREAVHRAVAPVHPEDPRIQGLSHVMWADRPKHPEAHARNAVFYGDKGIDRSPCGTGTSARWRSASPRACSRSATTSSTRASSARCSTAGSRAGGGRRAPPIRPSIGGWPG